MASYRAEPMQREEHREALLRLWGENMPDPAIAAVTPARFRWLYDQNPTVQVTLDGTVKADSTTWVFDNETFRVPKPESFFDDYYW